ncbi:MAG: hypothetical protein V3U84_12320 [Thiotrichaceae bacterium]
MKWLNRSLILIWIILLALGVWWSWYGFDNAMTLTHGGYLYDDEGNVIGLYDGWGEANYPLWMFPIWLVGSFFTSMSLWWMVAYWGIGAWLVLRYVLPIILSGNKVVNESSS